LILPGVSIGDNVIVGAGSIVTHDIPDNSLAVGVPAKVIKEIEQYANAINACGYLNTKGLSSKKKQEVW